MTIQVPAFSTLSHGEINFEEGRLNGYTSGAIADLSAALAPEYTTGDSLRA